MGFRTGAATSAPRAPTLASCFRVIHAALLTFTLLGVCLAAEARNWFIDPGLSLSGTYTDNVAPGLDGYHGSDFVSQINPEIKAALNGRRVTADLDYRLQNLIYARNNRSSTYQQYLARANTEILPEHFFLDAASSLTQQIVNSNGVRVNNNYAITGNRTDQLTASVRPSWRQAIGSYAEALVQAERGTVRYDDGKVEGTTSDSELTSASLTVNSLSQQRRLWWKTAADYQEVTYDDSAFQDLTFRHVNLLVGYEIIPGFTPLALAGYENNDFGDITSSTRPKDPIYGVGFRWQPNARTTLEALAGHRFFGNTYRVSWTQRGRYITSELEYSEDINGESAFVLENVSLVENPTAYTNFPLGLTGEVFLRKRVHATGQFKKSRTTITLTPFYEKREFDTSDQDSSIAGIDAAWAWRFGPRTALETRLHWDHTDQASGGDNQTFRYATIGLRRDIGKQTQASLGYAYTDVDSDDDLVAYTENAVTATLTHWFGKSRPAPTPPRTRARPVKPRPAL